MYMHTWFTMQASVPHLGQSSLLSFDKFCDSQTCVMVVTKNAPVKMTATFWAAHKPLA